MPSNQDIVLESVNECEELPLIEFLNSFEAFVLGYIKGYEKTNNEKNEQEEYFD